MTRDAKQTMGCYGEMTLDRWLAEGHMGKRVLLNGVDITDRCRSFDDQLGRAECLKEPIKFDWDGDPEVEYLEGKITVVDGPK